MFVCQCVHFKCPMGLDWKVSMVTRWGRCNCALRFLCVFVHVSVVFCVCACISIGCNNHEIWQRCHVVIRMCVHVFLPSRIYQNCLFLSFFLCQNSFCSVFSALRVHTTYIRITFEQQHVFLSPHFESFSFIEIVE